MFQLVERNATKIQLADLRTRQTVNVAVKDNVFIPRGIRIDPGSKVVFTNEGWSPHDIKASDGAQDFGARFRCRLEFGTPCAARFDSYLRARRRLTQASNRLVHTSYFTDANVA